MDVSLQSVEEIDLTAPERVINVLKATRQYPTTPQAKNTKLGDDIVFFCKAQEKGASGDEASDVVEDLWQVWSVVIDVAGCIASGHPWQQSLVQALGNLRQWDGTVRDNE